MAFRNRFHHSLMAVLACLAMISGCCTSGQCRKVRMPRVQLWPQGWARPTWMPASDATPLPVPADPSGSPYVPQSPRGLYVPSGPAPESKLGLPVPPPLPPRGRDAAPAPESLQDTDRQPLPPDAEDLDVSFQGRRGRPAVIAPQPPGEVEPSVPRMAELPRSFERERQPVSLEAPEPEFEPDLATEIPPQPSILRRSPVDAFPQPQRTANDFSRGGGHTPPFDDIEIEESEPDEEPLPELIDPSSHERGLILPKPVPDLGDADDIDAINPGVHRQTSAERSTRVTKSRDAERARLRLSVPSFRLTRDMRSGADAEVVSAQALQRGQNLVVQTELNGLKAVQRSGELVTRVSFHLEIRDARKQVLFATEKESSTETTHSTTESRQLTKWLAIPTALKPGDYVLQAHLKDVFSRQVTVVEMPVTIR